MLVSIDPGVRAAGVACWENSELACAFLARGSGWFDTATKARESLGERFPPGACVFTVVIERPQVYHQSKLKGDPNDLIEVALMAGAAAGSLAWREAPSYLPREWKGQVPKGVMIERIKARLSSEEHRRVDLPAKALQHNVWDAIGIGLHHLRRLSDPRGRRQG